MTSEAVTSPAEAEQALVAVQQCLADSLVAAYLHGSAVAGGLRPNSDVNLLVVTDQPTTHAVRKRLVTELMKISGHPAGVCSLLRTDLSSQPSVILRVPSRAAIKLPSFIK